MKITREGKIGLFTVICLATLVWGINFLKGKNIFSRTNTFYAVYNRVDGLKVTNDILLSGYKVGSVKGIEFEEGHTGRIIVTLLVEKKYLVPQNSVAKLITASSTSPSGRRHLPVISCAGPRSGAKGFRDGTSSAR